MKSLSRYIKWHNEERVCKQKYCTGLKNFKIRGSVTVRENFKIYKDAKHAEVTSGTFEFEGKKSWSDLEYGSS